MALQYAVIEHEVNPLVNVINQNLLLSCLEAETTASLKDEIAQIVVDRLFKIALFPSRRKFCPKELKHVLRLDKIVGV